MFILSDSSSKKLWRNLILTQLRM